MEYQHEVDIAEWDTTWAGWEKQEKQNIKNVNKNRKAHRRTRQAAVVMHYELHHGE